MILTLFYPPNILSMEALEGRVQLKMENCLFSLCGISLRPPPGWIMAARNWTSIILVNSPGFSRLKNPFCSISCLTISLVTCYRRHEVSFNGHTIYKETKQKEWLFKTFMWKKHFKKGKTRNNILISNLVPPFIDDRHVDVIDKNWHFLPGRRTICSPHPFIHIAFYCPLKESQS